MPEDDINEVLEYVKDKQSALRPRRMAVVDRILSGDRSDELRTEVERIQFGHEGLKQLLASLLVASDAQVVTFDNEED